MEKEGNKKNKKYHVNKLFKQAYNLYKSNVYRGDERIADKNKSLETIKKKMIKKENLKQFLNNFTK